MTQGCPTHETRKPADQCQVYAWCSGPEHPANYGHTSDQHTVPVLHDPTRFDTSTPDEGVRVPCVTAGLSQDGDREVVVDLGIADPAGQSAYLELAFAEAVQLRDLLATLLEAAAR